MADAAADALDAALDLIGREYALSRASRPPGAPTLRSSPFGYLFMPFKSSSFTKSKFKFSFLVF